MTETTWTKRHADAAADRAVAERRDDRYADAPPAHRAEIERAIAEIDITDSNSILFFGTAAQGEVTSVADEMLEGVRNKDTGPAGEALNEMVSALRGFAIDDLDPNKKRGLLADCSARPNPSQKSCSNTNRCARRSTRSATASTVTRAR